MDYAALRKSMVDEQLIQRGIKDKKVLWAFYKVERHRFVPKDISDNAYADFPLAIGAGQTISQPYMAALMTECLAFSGSERVLEIGTGSGYQTAILALLSKEVFSIERIGPLAKKTEALLKELAYVNIKIKTDDGTLGWPEESPFDRIIITAAASEVPLPLTEQLKDGGKIVLPLGEASSQVLTVISKKEDRLELSQVCPCVFVPLIGKFGMRQS
ncbi:MAG: protein-L-isoaspartate(D-aspartate) O-methyltransferase [Candidatus Omnitrophica bacterium]|nr:protein-L-isoaspartate(D-aspartate) O-methyltransferase [Candidatus Omnitrophota bacterium]